MYHNPPTGSEGWSDVMNAKSWFAWALSLNLCSAAWAATETYLLTDLGQIDNTSARVRINNGGMVLVYQPILAPTLIFDQGQVYNVTALLGVEKHFEGHDLNDEGIIVGRIFVEAVQEWHAVALLKSRPSDPFGTNIVDLGFLSKGITPQFAAISVNNDGMAVVCCEVDGTSFAIALATGTKRVLPIDFSPRKAGPGLSIAGRVNLPPENSGRFHAAWYVPPVRDLGTVVGNDPLIGSIALDAKQGNDGFIVVGWSGTGGQNAHAFRSDGGNMIDLDTKPHPEREGSTEARAVNSRGEIVGVVQPILPHAVLFKDGEVINLNFAGPKGILIRGAFGWTLQSADGINEYGEISGWGNTAVNMVRAFVLSPVRPFIQTDNNEVKISWPSALTGFVLESSEKIAGSPWQPVTPAAVLEGNRRVKRLPLSASSGFFRLREQ